ncbi:MAG: hypothetical protein A2095_01415 [Sphingomonadales bacterium GWF1_63_6]|nr:MAG: hypothetical protein A2095_01415 [Sphingomonadales bacterium GWF1_63_6]
MLRLKAPGDLGAVYDLTWTARASAHRIATPTRIASPADVARARLDRMADTAGRNETMRERLM